MKLKIAIQKSGRLSEDSLKLLKDCGIQFSNGVSKLKTEALNFPLEVLFLRDDDIPQYVEDKIADIGIVGENVNLEKAKNVEVEEKLDFGKCRLSIAVPNGFNYTGIRDLEGKRISTTYERILQSYLKEKRVNAEIHTISGSVELGPSIGLSDAICDLVSSGSTLFTNGLKEVEVILRSEAILIGSQNLDTNARTILNKLLFRIKAVKASRSNKYILLNCPNENIDKIISILPGMKSPTIMPLADKGWSSLHSVVNENDFWEVIDNLKQAGAQGILVLPIEKMIA